MKRTNIIFYFLTIFQKGSKNGIRNVAYFSIEQLKHKSFNSFVQNELEKMGEDYINKIGKNLPFANNKSDQLL